MAKLMIETAFLLITRLHEMNNNLILDKANGPESNDSSKKKKMDEKDANIGKKEQHNEINTNSDENENVLSIEMKQNGTENANNQKNCKISNPSPIESDHDLDAYDI